MSSLAGALAALLVSNNILPRTESGKILYVEVVIHHPLDFCRQVEQREACF